MDLTVRPWADSDAAALTGLLNDVEEFCGAVPFWTEQELREWVETWDDPAGDSRMVTAPDGSLVAFAVVERPPADGYLADAFATVAPRWRGHGIGRDLLSWQCHRIEELHGEIAPGREWVINAGSNMLETDAHHLFERFGMKVSRHWFDMQAPAGGAELPLDGFRVVPGTDAEIDTHALYEAHMEAFADHFGFQRRDFEEWSKHSIASALYRPELSRIAYDGDDIAGYVLSYDEAAPERLYIGQVGTRRPWRGRGLASALMSRVLVAAGASGKESVRLGVDATNPTGAVGVYERAGFAVSARAVSYRRTIAALR